MSSAKVAITGLGIVSSIGIGLEAFWEGLVSGESGIRSLSERTDGGPAPAQASDDSSDVEDARVSHPVWIGGPVTDFQPKQFVKPRKALKVMCREIQMAFAASTIALENAALTEDLPATEETPIRASRIGTVFGSEMFYGPPEEMQDAFEASIIDGEFDGAIFGNAAVRQITPLWMLKYLPNMPACHMGISVGAHGPNNSLIVGDVSAHSALMESQSCIQRDIADMVICGSAGTRISTTRLNYGGDYPLAQVHQPYGQMPLPFTKSATGIVGGEGAGTLILESADSAQRRSHTPLAWISGTASRFDPNRKINGHDVSRGSATAVGNAIDAAIVDAKLNVDAIDLIVSHAMGDPDMDAAELTALNRRLPKTPITCPTIGIGHAGAACGKFGLITAVLALQHQTIPPTVNAESAIDANVTSDAVSADLNHVLCLTHTSEGVATAVIISKSA